MMNAKRWWASKTFWVNAATLVAGVIGYIAGHELIADNASLVALLVAMQGAVNVFLRFISWQPIG
jgi:3-oxoacyl-ACP reductase-like protein